MGVFEEIIQNKDELIMKIIQILQGRETKTKINLDGVEFKLGEVGIKVDGKLEITIAPFAKKEEKE